MNEKKPLLRLNKLVDNVNELIRLGKGDLGRLTHIKDTLQQNKILYESDKEYLEKLSKQYLNDKSNVDATHYDQPNSNLFCFKCGQNLKLGTSFCPKCGNKIYDTNPYVNCNQSINSSTKHKNKGRNIGIVFGVIIFLFFVLVISSSDYNEFVENKIESNTFNSEPIIFSGSYDDLLRHEDEHKNKIVKFSGIVMSAEKTPNGYDITISNKFILDANEFYLIHNYHDRLLTDDEVSGYGTYFGICAQSHLSPFTCFKDVKLESIDFRTQTDGVCDDPIALKFGLC